MSFTYQSSNLSQAIKSNFAETENRLNALSHNIPTYNSTNRPNANSVSAGTMIWVSDKHTLMVSNGSIWLNVGPAVGSIDAFSSNTIPNGWIMADGSAGKSVVTTPALTDLFNYWGGAIYGGTGNTSFNLPDYRGRFLRGWANGSTDDPDRTTRTDRGDGTAGDNIGTKQAGQIQSHTHSLIRPKWYSGDSSTSNGSDGAVYGQVSSTTKSFFGTDVQSTGGNQTNPINITVMYCIKL